MVGVVSNSVYSQTQSDVDGNKVSDAVPPGHLFKSDQNKCWYSSTADRSEYIMCFISESSRNLLIT